MPTPSAPLIHQIARTADTNDTAAALYLLLILAAVTYAILR